MQLFQVSSANEWKTINVRDMFTESDEEVLVKCSTWTADGKRIICAARNAALVSFLLERAYSHFNERSCRLPLLRGKHRMCDNKDCVNPSCRTCLSYTDTNPTGSASSSLSLMSVCYFIEGDSLCLPESLKKCVSCL